MKKIVLTGGGTAGHVTPNIAILDKLKELDYEIHYIGQRNSVEERLIRQLPEKYEVKFHRISAGKLRRQKGFKNAAKNFADLFKVAIGTFEARQAISNIEPNIIFSKGGFVAVPVVLAGKLSGVPIVIHESDMTPGLTNKIALRFAEDVCVSFDETSYYIKKMYDKDAIITGTPVRREILKGDKVHGRKICNFKDEEKTTLLVMGGSTGSQFINGVVRDCIKDGLFDDFNVMHIVGPGNLDNGFSATNYIQFEYLNNELPDIMAYADLVITRAGANTIFEMLSLRKPSLLIPLSRKVSRGDQIDNAKSFSSKGYSSVLQEDDVTKESLVEAIGELNKNKEEYIRNMDKSNISDITGKIVSVINANCKEE